MADDKQLSEFRAASELLFEQYIDALIVREKNFYKVPDTVRPIIEQGMHAALEQLFDPKHYPNGMTREAVAAHAQVHLQQYLTDIFSPHLEALWLKGAGRARGSSVLLHETIPGHAEQLAESMQQEVDALAHEEKQRARLPMGTAALRAACEEEGAQYIESILAQLRPFYAVPANVEASLREALGTALDTAFADVSGPDGIARQPLVQRIQGDVFRGALQEACAQHAIVLRPNRRHPALAPKDLAPVFGLKHVQADFVHAIARCINDAFVREPAALQQPKPEPIVIPESIMKDGVVDYSRVLHVSGRDLLIRLMRAQDQLDVQIAGNPTLEPLQSKIRSAVREAQPPRKLRTGTDYFHWLEKVSARHLDTKLSLIRELPKTERDTLVESYKSLMPVMMEKAYKFADINASEGYIAP